LIERRQRKEEGEAVKCKVFFLGCGWQREERSRSWNYLGPYSFNVSLVEKHVTFFNIVITIYL